MKDVVDTGHSEDIYQWSCRKIKARTWMCAVVTPEEATRCHTVRRFISYKRFG
jgi:hypothetical protein